MRGRAPDPSRAKRGTGHRPLAGRGKAKVEIVVAPPAAIEADGMPPPPDYMDEEAKAVWYRAIDMLGGTLHPADAFALEGMVNAVWAMRAASAYVYRSGVLTEGANGQIRVAPWLEAQRQSTMTFLRLAEQLGFTRLARSRLGLINAAGAGLVHALMRDLMGDGG